MINIVPKFAQGWPSWLVELFGGIAAVALAHEVLYVVPVPAWVVEHVPFTLAIVAIATALSLAYERWGDRNGFSWSDVGQRSVGIAAGVALWTYVHVPILLTGI